MTRNLVILILTAAWTSLAGLYVGIWAQSTADEHAVENKTEVYSTLLKQCRDDTDAEIGRTHLAVKQVEDMRSTLHQAAKDLQMCTDLWTGCEADLMGSSDAGKSKSKYVQRSNGGLSLIHI